MVTIGEFARLGQVTVKALRHYDTLGLLKPAAIDPESGYRRYTEAQLPRLRRIGELKALGFRLEAIGPLLDEPPLQGHWRALLHERQSELLREIHTSRTTLSRVDREVRQLDDATSPQEYTVELVELEPVLVAGIRGRIATGTIYTLFELLRGWLAQQSVSVAGPFLTLAYSDNPYEADTHDAEAAVVLDTPLPDNDRVQVRELPTALAARVVHYGDYPQMYRAHEALCRWIFENGFENIDPGREIYWRDHSHVTSSSEFVTEILQPVRRRSSPTTQQNLSRSLHSYQLGELTLDIRVLEHSPEASQLRPRYLPEGLVVTEFDHRLYGATDAQGRIVLFWSWNPGISHIGLLWKAGATVPDEPEAYPDGERMRYYLPATNGHPATLILVDRGASVLLTSAFYTRDELLRIAESFPRATVDGTT